jgi:hypothetical protein
VEPCGWNLELMGGKAKHLVLLGPCGGQVGEAGNAHAVRKSTVNRRLDEIGREERKRDRHIDLADAAPLAFSNCFGGGYPVSREFTSQRRPRAIDTTNVARVFDRIGRAFWRKAPLGKRISRRRVMGALRQAMRRQFSADAWRSDLSGWASWMINCSD